MVKRATLITCAVLIFGFLIAIYIGKFIFPTWYIGVATTPEIVTFGSYIDAHWWANGLFFVITNFILGCLFASAVAGKLKFKWWQYLGIFATYLLYWPLSQWLSSLVLTIAIQTLLLWLIPLWVAPKAPYWRVIINYGLITLLITITLSIREIPIEALTNSASEYLVVTLDFTLWLGLMCAIFNIKKEGNKYGNQKHSTVTRR